MLKNGIYNIITTVTGLVFVVVIIIIPVITGGGLYV